MSTPLGKDAEFLDRHGIRAMSRNELEERVLEGGNFQSRGDARAEIVRRDRDYAEAQEQSRRDFQMAMFNAEGDRDVKRKQFEDALAERQMAHATGLAQEQLGAAQSAAKAAKFAAWATGAAALGAFVQAVIAALK